jgi:hypothetical protein
VVQQQQPDCLAPNRGNELSLHGFLGYEAHRPPRKSIRRIRTHHSDNLLRLSGVQCGFGARPRQVYQRTLQIAYFVSPSDIAHSLCRDSDSSRDRGRGLPLMQQQQSSRPLNHANRLNTAAQQHAKCIDVLGW